MSLRQAHRDAAALLDRPTDKAWLIRKPAQRFVGCQPVGVVADRRHRGERQHHQGNLAVPAVPGAALVVVEAERVLGGLEAALDRPTLALDLDQRLEGVPAGQHVVKNAQAPSAMVRRITRPRVHGPRLPPWHSSASRSASLPRAIRF